MHCTVCLSLSLSLCLYLSLSLSQSLSLSLSLSLCLCLCLCLSLSLYVDCDKLADDKTLHASGKDIMQIRSNMQDSLNKISNWCYNNHTVINQIKTKSMTIATRQKHQLSPLPLDLVLNGAKIDQVSEHRLLGITIDKLR